MRITNLSTHLTWTAVLLTAALAAMVVYAPTGEIVQSYTAFAATIAALVLAVVAIVYSMTSNQGLIQSLGAIQQSAVDVRSETEKLSSASQRFFGQANDMIDRLSGVPESVDQLKTDIGSKLETLVTSQIVEESGGQATDSHAIEPSGRSIASVIALYCVKRSFDRAIVVVPSKMFEDRYLAGFVLGYFQSMKEFRPCQVEIEGLSTEFLVKSLGTLNLDEFIDGVEKSKNEALRKYVPKLKEYFSESPDTESNEETITDAEENGIPEGA